MLEQYNEMIWNVKNLEQVANLKGRREAVLAVLNIPNEMKQTLQALKDIT